MRSLFSEGISIWGQRACRLPTKKNPNAVTSSNEPTDRIAPPEPAENAQATPPAPARQTSGGIEHRVDNVAVKNYDKVVFRGTVDLTESIERIRAGVKHPHRNDGSVFGNREGLLPEQPRGYYREYVHPTRGISGPGPQR